MDSWELHRLWISHEEPPLPKLTQLQGRSRCPARNKQGIITKWIYWSNNIVDRPGSLPTEQRKPPEKGKATLLCLPPLQHTNLDYPRIFDLLTPGKENSYIYLRVLKAKHTKLCIKNYGGQRNCAVWGHFTNPMPIQVIFFLFLINKKDFH